MITKQKQIKQLEKNDKQIKELKLFNRELENEIVSSHDKLYLELRDNLKTTELKLEATTDQVCLRLGKI